MVELLNYALSPFIKHNIQPPSPRVYATREFAAGGARYFGPFRSRRMVDLTIELVQKVFPVRTCTRSLPPQAKPSDPCLSLHLNRCPGPCHRAIAPPHNPKTINQPCAFLRGELYNCLHP